MNHGPVQNSQLTAHQDNKFLLSYITAVDSAVINYAGREYCNCNCNCNFLLTFFFVLRMPAIIDCTVILARLA